MLNPTVRLVHPALAGAEAVLDPKDHTPQHSGSGQYAVVFRMCDANRKEFGLKCFLHDIAGRDARYVTIQDGVARMRRTDSLVAFKYLSKAIKAKGGQLVPALRMDWVEGARLNTYIDEHVDESRTMLSLATQFRQAVVNLRREGVAHGDLQHGNILVLRDGRIRLVDLDGMFVPRLAGAQRFEAGLASYRHPYADVYKFDASIDDFPAWLIFLSLRALAKDPSLWQMRTGTDQLLLSAEDLVAPRDSEIVRYLAGASDPELRHIGLTLGRFLSTPATDVPSFRDESHANPPALPKWKPQSAPAWAQEPTTTAGPFVPVSLPQVPPANRPRRKKRTTQTGSQRPKQPAASTSTFRLAPEWAQPTSSTVRPPGHVALPDIPPTNSRQPKGATPQSATADPERPTRPVANKNHTASPRLDVRQTSDSSSYAGAMCVVLAIVSVVVLLFLAHVI